jgi:hypothetical protein
MPLVLIREPVTVMMRHPELKQDRPTASGRKVKERNSMLFFLSLRQVGYSSSFYPPKVILLKKEKYINRDNRRKI